MNMSIKSPLRKAWQKFLSQVIRFTLRETCLQDALNGTPPTFLKTGLQKLFKECYLSQLLYLIMKESTSQWRLYSHYYSTNYWNKKPITYLDNQSSQTIRSVKTLALSWCCQLPAAWTLEKNWPHQSLIGLIIVRIWCVGRKYLAKHR